MSRTDRHTKYKHLPKVEEIGFGVAKIDGRWQYALRTFEVPAQGWVETNKHYGRYRGHSATVRSANRAFRHNKSYRYTDFDDYTLPSTRIPFWVYD